MSSLRIVVGTIWIAIVLITHGIWSATALPVERTEIVVNTDSAEPVSDFDAPQEASSQPTSPPRMDRYGNEVESALTDYRIDGRGDLYERHHPQTALPEPIRPST